ncbi:MAG: isoprenylcysteine carboxylmethyltransferase family protein [Planctomycetota bacterium]
MRALRETGTESAEHAGVHCPPPFIFLAAVLVAGLLENRVWRWQIHGGGWPWIVSGRALLVGALLIMLWALTEFHRAKTTVHPARPSRALIERGPFRYSRNPLYFSLSLVLLAIGVSMGSGWLLVLVPPTILIVRHQVIAREERYLEKRFGEEYRSYCTRVNRWIGRRRNAGE